MTSLSFRRRGFTLIELLLVIGIIAILASIVIVAINPTKQLGNARDAQRTSNVNTILNAVYQYAIDHNGTLPNLCAAGVTCGICKASSTGTNMTTCKNGVSLRLLTGSYIVNIPADPLAPAAGTGTNYNISQDVNGRITVSAPKAEQTASISVTR